MTTTLAPHIFQSPNEFLEKCRALGTRWRSNRWHGGMGFREISEYLTKGTSRHVPEAEKIISEIEEYLSYESLAPRWQNSVAGAFPDVGAFLAGSPDSMRILRRESLETAPIKVFICTTCSAGVSTEFLLIRGISLLAFLLALIRLRPVEAWLFQHLDSQGIPVIKIPTSPPDYGAICLMLAEIAFTRGLTYAWASKNGASGGWAKDVGFGVEGCRDLLGGLYTEGDIIFPPVHLDEYNTFRDPKAWVLGKLKEIQLKGQNND